MRADGAGLGYADPAYARTLGPADDVIRLPASGGAVLRRSIAGDEGTVRDAAGPYPVFDCLNWAGVADDVAGLGHDLVSLVLVSDAFAGSARACLEGARADVLRPYKEHYVVDLDRPRTPFGRASRRRTALRASAGLDFAAVPGEQADASEWVALYAHLVARHQVAGTADLPAEALAAQLRLPGAMFLTARSGSALLAAQVCLRRGDVVYSHLASSSPEGYRRRAMHALDLFALEHFSSSAAWFDLGGGRGGDPGTDGLAAYKASWASSTRPTWLAGWVLNAPSYRREVERSAPRSVGFFPAYRAPAC